MFDMDGVLIQSREVIERAWIRVARDYGLTLSAVDIDRHIHGRPGSHTLDVLFGSLPEGERRVVRQRVDSMEETADCDLTAGVEVLLDELKGAGVPAALVTSSWPARIAHVLRQHRLTWAFQTIVHRDDVTSGKPSGECYLLAASRLGVPSAWCIAFEDSESGVMAALRSGARCIGIGEDAGMTAAGACMIRPSFAGLCLQDLRGCWSY